MYMHTSFDYDLQKAFHSYTLYSSYYESVRASFTRTCITMMIYDGLLHIYGFYQGPEVIVTKQPRNVYLLISFCNKDQKMISMSPVSREWFNG